MSDGLATRGQPLLVHPTPAHKPPSGDLKVMFVLNMFGVTNLGWNAVR